jgi:hypothetical protein
MYAHKMQFGMRGWQKLKLQSEQFAESDILDIKFYLASYVLISV